MFALVSPSCGICGSMPPVFAEAASERRVVLVSAADEPDVRRYLDERGIGLPLVTDPDVYDANDIPWPPYTVVTDAGGTVLAAGGADTPGRFRALLRRADAPRPA